jgi:hypothetical protein
MRKRLVKIMTVVGLGAVLAGAASCSTPQPAEPEPPSARAEIPTRANGLVIRELRVRDQPAVVQSVLMRHQAGEALDPAMHERFRRNGMRMVRVPASNLEQIVDGLGGALRDIDGWHGQAIDWRELATWELDQDGSAVAVDGRIRRFVGGRFRLLARAWTIPMETGPAMQFELLADHQQSTRLPLERLLRGRGVGEGDEVRFRTMSHEMLLEPGYAYVLTGADPRVDWALDTNEPMEPDSPKDGDESSIGGDAAAASERAVGPFVDLPRTLGESFFCRETKPPCRELLVLVPHLPRELFPVEVSGVADADREHNP